MTKTDFLIIGGGIIGVTIAREIKSRYPDATITVLEKEPECGRHASGRNSGVLHAGFYYSADSLKARYTQLGNQLLSDYCRDKGLRINPCGKLVVARNEDEQAMLDELLRRGQANGVPLQAVSEAEARDIEPRIKTCGRALYSPTTASVDPLEILQAMGADARAAGIQIHTATAYQARVADEIHTSGDTYQAGYVINAGGLYADRIAADFGFSRDHRILPFKGLYLYCDEPANAVRTNVYPVPDLRNPFLGVHYTVTVDGHCKIGPTAIPALWREQYRGLSNFHPGEFARILGRHAGLWLGADNTLRRLAVTEVQKYSRRRLVQEAALLISGVEPQHYRRWARPGIRAQLLNIRTKKLEMDFVIEGDKQSMHILNAVSPAFTCALPFARHVCDEVAKQLQ